MYLKKERSILLGAADCAVGAGPHSTNKPANVY